MVTIYSLTVSSGFIVALVQPLVQERELAQPAPARKEPNPSYRTIRLVKARCLHVRGSHLDHIVTDFITVVFKTTRRDCPKKTAVSG